MKINYIKPKFYYTQQNSKFRLCGERDETFNQINKYGKLAQKQYKTRHDWVRMV